MNNKHGLPQKILAHFTAFDDDEWMSYDDACIKFDCTKDRLLAALTKLRGRGLETFNVIQKVNQPRRESPYHNGTST